jgi:hypothetical protein
MDRALQGTHHSKSIGDNVRYAADIKDAKWIEASDGLSKNLTHMEMDHRG